MQRSSITQKSWDSSCFRENFQLPSVFHIFPQKSNAIKIFVQKWSLFHILLTSFAFFLQKLFSRLSPNFCNYHLCPQGNFCDNAKREIFSVTLNGQKGVAKGVKRVSRFAKGFKRVSRNVSEGCRRMFMYLKKVSSFMTKGETLGRLWPGRSNICSTTTSVPAFNGEKQTGLLEGQ